MTWLRLILFFSYRVVRSVGEKMSKIFCPQILLYGVKSGGGFKHFLLARGTATFQKVVGVHSPSRPVGTPSFLLPFFTFPSFPFTGGPPFHASYQAVTIRSGYGRAQLSSGFSAF